MLCPFCGTTGAVFLFTSIACDNPKCKCYVKSQGETSQPVEKLGVTAKDKVLTLIDHGWILRKGGTDALIVLEKPNTTFLVIYEVGRLRIWEGPVNHSGLRYLSIDGTWGNFYSVGADHTDFNKLIEAAKKL